MPDPLAGLRVLDNARPFDPGDNTDSHLKARSAFERLADGSADNDDFDRVAIAINLCKVLARDIDAGLAETVTAAQQAMTALRVRQERWGKWDLLPTERAAILEAIDINEVVIDASSPLQVKSAIDVVRRSILLGRSQATKPIAPVRN